MIEYILKLNLPRLFSVKFSRNEDGKVSIYQLREHLVGSVAKIGIGIFFPSLQFNRGYKGIGQEAYAKLAAVGPVFRDELAQEFYLNKIQNYFESKESSVLFLERKSYKTNLFINAVLNLFDVDLLKDKTDPRKLNNGDRWKYPKINANFYTGYDLQNFRNCKRHFYIKNT